MRTFRTLALIWVIGSILLSACNPAGQVSGSEQASAANQAKPTFTGAFYNGTYQNLFKEYLGKSDAEIQDKIDLAFNQLFYGDDDTERIYYPVEPDMAYIEDIGNQDVRSEGMSYGMMIAVQLNKQEEFNRIWKWAKTHMYQSDGPYMGYFAWHCTTDGEQIEPNPASDGEEWFIMALLFADARWGSGAGIYDYRSEAQAILHTALHKDEEPGNRGGTNLFDSKSKQVVFVPAQGQVSSFTDPSYHLPHFYQLWALMADEDQTFWTDAAAASRQFLPKTAHPQTGLMPDYANFDGTPYANFGADHKDFRFDAWRTLANVAVDYSWFANPDEDLDTMLWQIEQSNRVLSFLASQEIGSYPNQYELDGTPLSGDHSTGLAATAAAAALAADPEVGRTFVQALWDTPVPSGRWRYYDGMLYLLAVLQVSGNFRIYIETN